MQPIILISEEKRVFLHSLYYRQNANTIWHQSTWYKYYVCTGCSTNYAMNKYTVSNGRYLQYKHTSWSTFSSDWWKLLSVVQHQFKVTSIGKYDNVNVAVVNYCATFSHALKDSLDHVLKFRIIFNVDRLDYDELGSICKWQSGPRSGGYQER